MVSSLAALIVEDSPTDAKLTLAQLRAWGYEVEHELVATADAMRGALARRLWDVVISDWSLPGFGGTEALALLRETGGDIPFIIVSGVADDNVAVGAMRRGASDFLSKDSLARLGGAVERELLHARARREDAVRREEEERFFDLAPDLLCVAGLDGKLIRTNTAWETTLGWTYEELCPSSLATLLHPDDRAEAAERGKALASGSCTLSWQARYRHRDGSYRSLEWTATSFGRERLVFAAARDITARKLAEDSLRVSQARFTRLAESGIVAIAVADVLGNLHEVNRAYADIVGYSREELLSGKVGWAEQTPPEWQATDEAAIAMLKETGVAAPFEKELFRKDGTRVPVLVGVAMLDYPNCIAFLADLTGRKKAEESLRQSEAMLRHAQKMEALGQLAAGVAHEINTPAQFITDNLAFLQGAFDTILAYTTAAKTLLASGSVAAPDAVATLKSTCEDEELEFVIDQVPLALEQSIDGIRRVTTIVSAMKSFSHRSSDAKLPMDLREIVETGVEVTRNRWKYVADVTTEFEPDLPPVPCDRDQMSQVILNLIINAADAISEAPNPHWRGPHGKGKIIITVRVVGGHQEIRVVDDGPGIPDEIRSRIFEPFFTTKPIGKGTGQGLALAHAIIVDKHHGELSFETSAGGGTTFVIRLPMSPDAAARSSPPETASLTRVRVAS